MKLPRLRALALSLSFAFAALTATAADTGSTGSGSPVDNTQPTLAVRWMICVAGIFPSQGGGLTGDPYIGEIRPFASANSTMNNWLSCDGTLLPINQNQALFSILGTTYGGNGTTTFALPDLRGRVPVASGQGSGLTNRALGAAGGVESPTLTTANLPAHTHTLAAGATGSTGTGTALDNTQPWLAVTVFLQHQGIYGTEIGWVRFFAGNFAPGGAPLCDGRLIAISQNTALFSLLGTTYGGNGTTTFAVPDLRGRTSVGAGQNPGLSNRVLGAAAGSETIALTSATMPAHTHTVSGGSTGSTGGGGAHDTMQPHLALNWIIAMEGVYGSPSGDTPGLTEMRLWAPSFIPTDYGWASVNGAHVSIAENEAFFSLVGTTYGGNGETTFALPDTRGRALAHTGTGTGLTARAVGAQWGAESVTLTTAQLPAHTHSLPVVTAPTVTTPTSTGVTATGATLGGNVTGDGGDTVTARGVVVAATSVNADPQLAGTGVTNLTGIGTTGVFTVNATGLSPNTAYTYAAYATNGTGTTYSTTGTFTTLPAAPAITSSLTAGGTYAAAIATYTITGSNTPASYSATGLPSGLTVNTGNGEITGTPTQTGEFNITIGAINAGGTGTATLVLTIAKAAATVTLGSLSPTYDGNPLAATATTSPGSLTVNFTYDASGTAPTNAGSYAVIGTISDANYQGTASGTLVIGQKQLTVTADNQSRPFNTPNPTLTATITGFASGETAATALTGVPDLSTTAVALSAPNNYPITVALGGLVASLANYTFSFVAGTLTVTGYTYGVWQPAMFTVGEQSDSAISGPAADPDHDGISNTLEYAFDLAPKTAEVGGLPVAGTVEECNEEFLALTYTRQKFVNDLTYAVQVSADLVTWSAATPVEINVTDNGATETVTVRDTVVIGTTPRRFMRVVVALGGGPG